MDENKDRVKALMEKVAGPKGGNDTETILPRVEARLKRRKQARSDNRGMSRR